MTDNGERRRLDDEYLTRREAETLIDASSQREEAAKEAHQIIHDAQQLALETAMQVAERDRKAHDVAHEREHELHSEKHAADALAVSVALAAVARERQIHADAHEKEHFAHQRVHEMAQDAVAKAEKSVEERLKAMNEFRGQLRDQQATFATRETLDTLRNEVDRRFGELNTTMLQHFQSSEKLTQDRFETNRTSIIELQKTQAQGQARGQGYSSLIGWIIAAVGFVTTVVILANTLLGKAPA